MADDDNVIPFKGRPCPICGRLAVKRFDPFCSERCKDVDLGRWLTESYRIPTEDEPDDEDGALTYPHLE